MALTHITTHVADALARLPEQYKGKPRMEALVTALVTPVQELEDSLWDVWTHRILPGNPTGDLLAKLGALVGQSSLGRTDSEYRLMISARILANKSDGRKFTMVRIARLLAPGLTVKAFDLPSTTFFLEVEGPVTVDPYVMFNYFLRPALGAGVRLEFSYTTVSASTTLTWGSSYASSNPGASQSPGSSYQTGGPLGGKWADAIGG